MITYFTDRVEPFRPEWTVDNVINGKIRNNKNSALRERTIGIYEDFTTGNIIVACAIRHIVDKPSSIGRTVVKSRIHKLRESNLAADKCAILFNSRDEVYDCLVEENVIGDRQTIEADELHGYISRENLDKAFKRISEFEARINSRQAV
jgi:hypothetical protein